MDIDYRGIWAAFERARAPALMVVLNNNGRWDRSNVVFRDGQLLKYDKRVTDPEMTYIDYGVALLRREIVERIPEHQSFDLADLYRRLVEERLMVGYEVTERFYEIGSPEGLAEAERVFSSRSGDGP
jgi:NDP-sugar pyrophosphorylase family protein